jgi:hypothetical protein
MKRELELDPTKCCEFVCHYIGSWMHSKTQCSHKWSVARDGKHYCRQHDPVRKKKREMIRNAKYDYDQASRAMGWVGVPLYDALEKLIDRDASGMKKAKVALASARRYRRILKEGKPK